MGRPSIPVPAKQCSFCRVNMTRKRFNGVLEDRGAFMRRKFCDQVCMARAMEGTMKVPSPRNSRKQSVKKRRPDCEVCGRSRGRLYVHHRDENPMNNAPENLQTLCGSCHRRSHSPNFSGTPTRKPCKHCSSPAQQVGLCWTHLTRYKRYGDPLLTKLKIGSVWRLTRVSS